MKVLYVIRSIAHFAYHETILRHLCERGHEIMVLFDEGWSQGQIADASKSAVNKFLADYDNARTGWSCRRDDVWRSPLFFTREFRSYLSYLNREDQSEFYLRRWEQYQPWWLRRMLKPAMMRKTLKRSSALLGTSIKTVETLVSPASNILKAIEKYGPDVVVASPVNMRFSEEVEYLKAARAMKVPTALPVLSWDNLTTKGLIHVLPDLTLVWNTDQLKEAEKIHGVPSSGIAITGAPFFDKWFDRADIRVSREDFCRKVGIDAGRPYIVYLGSSANIAKDESWLPLQLSEELKRNPSAEVRGITVVVRPHPANSAPFKKLAGSGIKVWPQVNTFPSSTESFADFFNTVFHSIGTIGINTSGMIDAVVCDKPCLTLITEMYSQTQMEAMHFKVLFESGSIETALSLEQLVSKIRELLEGEDGTAPSRRQFVSRFVRPQGMARPAGSVAAEMIENLAHGR